MISRKIHIYDGNLKALEGHELDDSPFIIVVGDFVDIGYDPVPPENYEFPKKFPGCCNYHKSILQSSTEWFNNFPDCCNWHRELSRKHWFDKNKYNGIPFKITKCAYLTEHHIQLKVNSSEWYKEITDYIEYNIGSFGTPSVGADRYVANTLHYIKNTKSKELTKEKRRTLIDYIKQQSVPSDKSPSDLNLLYSTFKKWLNAIPELDIFYKFKNEYKNKFPINIMLYETETNLYSGLTKSKIRTKKELVTILTNTTMNSLRDVDSAVLLKNNIITDVNKHHFDIASSKRKIKQETLLGKYSKGEIKYLNVMQEWLANEEEYFTYITPLLKSPDYPTKHINSLSEKIDVMDIKLKISALESALKKTKELLASTVAYNNTIKLEAEIVQSLIRRAIYRVYDENSSELNLFNQIEFEYTPRPNSLESADDIKNRRTSTLRSGLKRAETYLEEYIDELKLEQLLHDDKKMDIKSEVLTPVANANPSINFKKIFISHASADAKYAEELIELLKLVGLKKYQIFCTSVKGYGIKIGKNYLDSLKQEISEDSLVIFLYSSNFFSSHTCLAELGATWVLSKEHVPIIILPFEFKNIEGTLPHTQGLAINDKLIINDLARHIVELFSLEGFDQDGDWERSRDLIINRINLEVERNSSNN